MRLPLWGLRHVQTIVLDIVPQYDFSFHLTCTTYINFKTRTNTTPNYSKHIPEYSLVNYSVKPSFTNKSTPCVPSNQRPSLSTFIKNYCPVRVLQVWEKRIKKSFNQSNFAPFYQVALRGPFHSQYMSNSDYFVKSHKDITTANREIDDLSTMTRRA